MRHFRTMLLTLSIVCITVTVCYPQLQMRKISGIDAVKLYVTDDNRLFVCDNEGYAQMSGNLGVNWESTVGTAHPVFALGVSPSGSTRIAVQRFGYWPGPYAFNVFTSRNNGQTNLNTSIYLGNRNVMDLIARDNGRLAVLTDSSGFSNRTLIYYSKDFGATWDTIFAAVASQGIRFIRQDENEAYINQVLGVYRLHYTEKKFELLFNLPSAVRMIEYDKQQTFYGYNQTENKITFSTDNGSGWFTVGNPLPFSPTAIKLIQDTVYCSAGTNLYASADTCKTWKHIAIGNDIKQVHRIAGLTYGIAKFASYGLGVADMNPNYLNGTNYMSLKKGSQLLYFLESGGGRTLQRCEINRDTLIPGSGKTYLIADPPNFLLPHPFRYDQSGNRLFVYQSNLDLLEMDFSKNIPGATFMRSAYPAVVSTNGDSIMTVAGRQVRVFSQRYQFDDPGGNFTHKVYKYYCDSIGVVRYDSLKIATQGYPYFMRTSAILAMALIHLGDTTTYYSAHHKPKLTIEPKQALSVMHYKQYFTLSHPLTSYNLVFVDKIEVEHYYKKMNDSIPLPKYTIEPGAEPGHYFYMNLDSSLFTQGYTYYYRITATDKSLIPEVTTVPETGFFAVNYDPAASVDDGEQPKTFALEQNYPNPFNPSTTISYTIPQSGRVSLKVYSVLGSEVATLHDGYQSAGTHSVQFNAAALPSGTYFYRLSADGRSETKKFVLLK